MYVCMYTYMCLRIDVITEYSRKTFANYRLFSSSSYRPHAWSVAATGWWGQPSNLAWLCVWERRGASAVAAVPE